MQTWYLSGTRETGLNPSPSTLRTGLFSRTLPRSPPRAPPGPSCHPSAAFQLGKMGVSHLCWGRRSLFTHLCSHPGKTSQGEL